MAFSTLIFTVQQVFLFFPFQVIKTYTQCSNIFLVATYSRKILNQTGDGHFSPIAGYHPDQDLVLIMDTARFKYPPHWVKLPHLLEAMNALDKDTGQ